jgi:hypothetical protein
MSKMTRGEALDIVDHWEEATNCSEYREAAQVLAAWVREILVGIEERGNKIDQETDGMYWPQH